jgi:hypothetical protein
VIVAQGGGFGGWSGVDGFDHLISPEERLRVATARQ